ncbi:MAG: TetR/AcrR family transcriptional regulator [Cyclobacteriaceae bacterium]
MTTKEKILEAALHLFNNQGVESITTRHVATSLGMSQGNLHYHFPNKNKLLEKLYEMFKEGLVKRSSYQMGTFGLAQIYESLLLNFDWMWENRFLFLDREIVWRRLPNIKRETQGLITMKTRQLNAAIETLKQQGVFRADLDQAQVDSFINLYQIIINSWQSSAYLFEKEKPTFFADNAFRAWYPYLTEMGTKEFDALIK